MIHTKYKAIVLFILFLLSVNSFAAYSGTPTALADMKTDADGCYLIGTAEDLYGFAAIVNGTDDRASESNACGKLIEDIVVNSGVLDAKDNLSGDSANFIKWTPVGYHRGGDDFANFGGSFDGDGHTISGLYFNDKTKDVVGLFGYVSNSDGNAVTISNVGVVDSYFSNDSVVGGLVGMAETELIISNSYNVGHMNSSIKIVGGLVGFANSKLTISNSYNAGSIDGGFESGGLVGVGYVITSIIDSYNTGAVSGIGEVGGIIGSAANELTISNSHNMGRVYSNNMFVGGLLGLACCTAYIINSYNQGPVTGPCRTGGLVGLAYLIVYIINSYNQGTVTGTGWVLGANKSQMGGLVGSFGRRLTISNSYNVGHVTGYGDDIGGLVGANYFGSDFKLAINNSYALEGCSLILTAADSILDGSTYSFKSKEEFLDGTVALALHDWCEKDGETCKEDGFDGSVWGQKLTEETPDEYPTLSGKILYDLKLNPAGGALPDADEWLGYEYGKGYTLPEPARVGYTFAGWFADLDDESAVTQIKADETGEKAFVAKWEAVKYTITFKFGEAEETAEVAYDAIPSAPSVFSCPEKTAEYSYSCSWDKEFAVVTGAETYTYMAAATKNKYTVFADANDSRMGSVTGAGEYEYGTEVELVATAIDGYNFYSWEDDVKMDARMVKVTADAYYKAIFVKGADVPVVDVPVVDQSSSSSVIVSDSEGFSSSSAKAGSSSSKKRNSSSSAKKDAVVASAAVPQFSVAVVGRDLQIAGATVGAKVAVFDMQGSLISTGRVDAANFSVAMPRSGSYMVRVGSQTKHVNVK